MSAPANVLLGARFDYAITLTYNGELTGPTADYTLTDALPAQVGFFSAGITNGDCPTRPAPGQSGTVSCTFKFAPLTKTTTITISVETKATGSITNTAQLASGPAGSATTSIDPLPAGSVTVTMTGPDTIALSSTVAPARITYTILFGYTGPPINGSAVATFVDRLPDQMRNPGTEVVGGDGLRDCTFSAPSSGGTVACSVVFTEDHRTRTILVTARPTGATGKATNMVEVSTGATASWTTTIEPRPAEPSSSTTSPAPLAGPAAAPTTTVAESFTQTGATEPESVNVSSTAETVQVALTWPDSGSSFDATSFTLSSPTRALASIPASAVKLRITKKRGARWLDVRIKGVHRGKLRFKIVAKRLHGRTRVVAKIRQSKR